MILPALRSRLAATALAVAALALLPCLPARAARGARHPRRPHRQAMRPVPAPPALPAGLAGMVVAIEPETGALVPPRGEQLLRLGPAEATGMMRSTEGLTQVHFPDGSVMMDLQGRFMDFSVVQLDRQGRPRLRCVDDPGALRALLAPAPEPRWEEK